MVSVPLGVRRSILPVVAGTVWLLTSGCATLHPPPPPAAPAQTAEATTLKQTETLLAMVKQVGWKEVQDLLPGFDEQSDANFPGVAALAGDLHSIATTTRFNRGTPPVDIGQLLDHNPHFWRAYYEIAPGDPLTAMLHVGLLLAAGDAVTRAYATLAEKARAALAVWPKNPEAWADLVMAQQAPAGDQPAGPSLVELHQVDPLFVVPATVAGPEPAALTETRRLWLLINDD
jgi:predicted NAD/FAD-dependent oxidoreductase